MRVDERLFSVLLQLYPEAFRTRYRLELLDTFRRDRQQPRFAGIRGGLAFWRHTISDLIRTASSERRRMRQEAETWSLTSAGAWRDLGRDVSVAVRGLRKRPGYATIAILTLGLGVGATTAVFAVVDGVLLTPLPYAGADRLVRVYEREHNNPGARMVAYGNFDDLHRQARGFESLAAWQNQSLTLTGEGPAVPLTVRLTSADFARVFQETPVLGRWFTDTETTGNASVVVLTYALWQNTFGGTPDVLGRAIRLDGTAYEVIGVMAPTFRFPGQTDVWMPLPPVRDPVGQRRWHRHSMVGRLADGVTLEQVTTELDTIATNLEAAYPDYNKDNYFDARPLLDDMVGSREQSLLVLFGAVSVLLLIACVNVASLSLARSISRTQEMSVRSALGASRWRLARLFLTESLLLGAIGSAFAVLVAQVGVARLMAMASDTLPRAAGVTAWTPAVIGFGVVASVLASIGVALPAIIGRHHHTSMTLRGTRGTASQRLSRGRRVLVVAQLTAAFVLATGAGLLLASVARLQAIDAGVTPDRVLTFDIRLPSATYQTPDAVARFIDTLMTRFEQLPAVERAGVTLTPPVNPYGWYNSLTIRGREVPTADLPPISYVVTSEGYFDTVGIPVLAGRTYRADEPTSQQVAVINETTAKRFWPDSDPIGALILGRSGDESSWARIIGVVGDVPQSLDAPIAPEVYVPLTQDIVRSLVVVARTRDADTAAIVDLRRILSDADSDVPITEVMSLDARIAQGTAEPTLNAVLMSTFAGTALLLAAAGVFAMVSFSVAERRREFGIRVAVGASRPRIFLDVLGTNLRLALWAVGLGLVGIKLGGRALEGLLFGVESADTSTIVTVALVVLVVSSLSGVWPARRAARVDPLVALREG